MSLSQQSFLAPKEQKQEVILERNDIVQRLLGVAEKYNAECKDDKPGKDGIKKKLIFLMKVAALVEASTAIEGNNALVDICQFYLKNRGSGRLLRILEDELIKIFNIQIDCKPLCEKHDEQMRHINSNYRLPHMGGMKARIQAEFFHQLGFAELKRNAIEHAINHRIKESNILLAVKKNLSSTLIEHLSNITCEYLGLSTLKL